MTKPDVGLHLFVKNGATVVGRLLDNVGPYVREVVAVCNDCSDDTVGVLASGATKHGLDLKIHHVTATTHSDLYYVDEPGAYAAGSALCGETFPGPFTGAPILGDWAGARNVGWQDGSARWRLILDADDVVDEPEGIPMLISDLDAMGAAVVASEYVHASVGGVSATTCLRERLALADPAVRWEGAVHERLVGYNAKGATGIWGQLRVRDLRDSTGVGVRGPARNLKILYRIARLSDWSISARHAALLAAESKSVMGNVTVRLAEEYTSGTFGGRPGQWWGEEAAWICCQAGEAYEAEGCPGAAVEWFERALTYYKSPNAAFRLVRARAALGDNEGVRRAYQQGLEYVTTPQSIDGGSLLRRAVRCLVVGALANLGLVREAVCLCDEALGDSPDDTVLAEMRILLLAALTKDDLLSVPRRRP